MVLEIIWNIIKLLYITLSQYYIIILEILTKYYLFIIILLKIKSTCIITLLKSLNHKQNIVLY